MNIRRCFNKSFSNSVFADLINASFQAFKLSIGVFFFFFFYSGTFIYSRTNKTLEQLLHTSKNSLKSFKSLIKKIVDLKRTSLMLSSVRDPTWRWCTW
jgi:hypothetical protein